MSFWVIGAWIVLTLVWLVPFQFTGQSKATVQAIAEDWFALRIVYLATAVVTTVCTYSRIKKDWRRRDASVRPTPTEAAQGPFPVGSDDIEAWLRSQGYRVTREDQALRATVNRYSLLGGSVFHVGIVAVGLSLALHSATVESVSLRVTEGQTFAEAGWTAEEELLLPSSIRHHRLVSITPEYYEDVLLFTRLTARIETPAGTQQEFSLARPYWIDPVRVLSIQDYNLAPHIAVVDWAGEREEHVIAMNLSPPGTEDSAEIPVSPLYVSLIAYPDYGVVDGRNVSMSYNIVEPAFLMSVQTGDRAGPLKARELLRLGDSLTVDGYEISVPELSRYGTFRLTTAPGLPLVLLSLLMTLIGLAWRFFLRRHDVMAWETDEGLMIDGWTDMRGREAGRGRLIRLARQAGVLG